MSRSEQEHGTISIPKKEWAKMKKAMIMANNRVRQEMIEKATKMQDEVKAHFKGKRNVGYTEVCYFIESRYEPCEAYYMLMDSLKLDGYKMAKITQSIADKSIKKANTKTTHFSTSLWDFSLSLDNDKSYVYWDVEYTSNAIKRTRKNALASELLKILSKVDYGNKYGGCFYGNDEYNIHDGTGEQYITACYGAGQDAKR